MRHETAPLPAGMRDLLLGVLAIAYPDGAAQRRLSNAEDSAVAWQVQSALDDYSDATSALAFAVLA
jgi:hypothetical protein